MEKSRESLSDKVKEKFDIPERLFEEFHPPEDLQGAPCEEKILDVLTYPEGETIVLNIVSSVFEGHSLKTKQGIIQRFSSIEYDIKNMREKFGWSDKSIQGQLENEETGPYPKSRIEWEFETLDECSYIEETGEGTLRPTSKLAKYLVEEETVPLTEKGIKLIKQAGLLEEDYQPK